MSNHNGNANKMVDTPRSDPPPNCYEGHYDDPFHSLMDFAKQLERELNAALDHIKRLEEWKESALAVEREWDANAIATMLGGRLGESQREVVQREVPKLLARIKRLEEAGDALKAAGYFGGWADAVNKWVKVREEQP